MGLCFKTTKKTSKLPYDLCDSIKRKTPILKVLIYTASMIEQHRFPPLLPTTFLLPLYSKHQLIVQ